MSLFLVILIGMAFGSVATMECPAGCQQCRIEAVICERMDLQNFVPSGPEDRIYADIISFRESRNLATDLIECAILIQAKTLDLRGTGYSCTEISTKLKFCLKQFKSMLCDLGSLANTSTTSTTDVPMPTVQDKKKHVIPKLLPTVSTTPNTTTSSSSTWSDSSSPPAYWSTISTTASTTTMSSPGVNLAIMGLPDMNSVLMGIGIGLGATVILFGAGLIIYCLYRRRQTRSRRRRNTPLQRVALRSFQPSQSQIQRDQAVQLNQGFQDVPLDNSNSSGSSSSENEVFSSAGLCGNLSGAANRKQKAK